VGELREELGFELEEIAIDGDPDLEARYRELLPVVEIDGKQAFVYFVEPMRSARRSHKLGSDRRLCNSPTQAATPSVRILVWCYKPPRQARCRPRSDSLSVSQLASAGTSRF
jgi:hypothetical protein